MELIAWISCDWKKNFHDDAENITVVATANSKYLQNISENVFFWFYM